jgi:hypothetical protein
MNPAVLLSMRIPPSIRRPLIRLLDGRFEEDVFPTFYRVNQPAAIVQAARETHFEVTALNLCRTSAFTGVLGPLSIFELLYLRLLGRPRFAHYRTNVCVVLRRP